MCYPLVPFHSSTAQDAHLASFGQSSHSRARYHKRSGYTFGNEPNTFEQFHDGPLKQEREINVYYPFQSRAEWSLAKFLVENLTQTQIKRFLALPWFHDNPQPSFTSVEELLRWMDTLPSGPKWWSTVLEVEGYKTTDSIQLIWHDAEEVTRSLFGNPIFGADMMFDPILITNGLGQEYSEWFSVREAHRIQDSLPEGATIIPILAASDKTPVTRMTGGLEMHPLLISIGNIPGNIRMAATSHSWRCVAFMPIPKFDVPKGNQTILQTRVWHKCVDIVTTGLKRVAEIGTMMPDPHGYRRYCFMPLVAWTTDLPEQLMITCVSKSASPVTEATHKQFGDSHSHSSRTGNLTLQHIEQVARGTHPWNNLSRFQREAKTIQLSSVHLPFWRNWPFVDPSIFLLPEILHTCHKFFFDHVLSWCRELLEDDLNARFKCHHKCVVVRHFAGGVSHIKQMTGREHRDIQRTIVPMIAGCVPPWFLRAICAIISFIYQAQSPIHTDISVKEMESSLQEFHVHKDAIIKVNARKTRSAGTKNDFHIPKLELFHSFTVVIRNNGGLIQYTADVSERLLITHCKRPFERTNKNKDFAEQVVRLLDCKESMQQFDVYLLIHSSNIPLINAVSMEEEEIAATDPTFTWVGHVLPEEQWQLHGPHPVRNYFADGILTNHTQTALHVTSCSDETNLSLNNIAEQYQLPYFQDRYLEFLQSHSLDLQFDICTFDHIAVWHKLRVQLHSTFHNSMILPSQVVRALRPSQDFPYGCYDIVLISPSNDTASYVAQVRTIFQPCARPRSKVETPPYLNHPLIYLQPFCVIATPQQQPELHMWTLERCFSHMEEGGEMREGLVVPITWISHALELVPIFGSGKVPPSISSTTSQELYHHFFLNHFADKEIFNAFHGGGSFC
ncbi:hypothetical protein BKA82DRAFT_3988476 [Pisolithus tinctorius]|nr:hypothetical protein BKA82DRAFT_3988476 [Pisolithus tinctorius]